MSQIRDKKAHRKHIATMNPINAKSVQLIELHAFAYCLLSVSLSESFDFLLFRFLRKVIKLRKSGTPLPRTPWVKDESLCTHCGLCVVHCPAGAITKGDELNVDETKCIKCCACVKVCPRNAKVYDTPFAALLSDCFKKQKQPQTIL